MSGNTNNIFWVICGAVIVTTIFSLISNNHDYALTNTLDKMNSYFKSAALDSKSEENPIGVGEEKTPIENEEQETIPEIDPEDQRIKDELYNKYTAKGWNIIDIAVKKGVACIGFNFSKNGNNSYSWQILVINTNNYEVHLKNIKWTYYDSNTNEILLILSPYEWQLGPDGMIMSGTANSVPMSSIDHYFVLTWGD